MRKTVISGNSNNICLQIPSIILSQIYICFTTFSDFIEHYKTLFVKVLNIIDLEQDQQNLHVLIEDLINDNFISQDLSQNADFFTKLKFI